MARSLRISASAVALVLLGASAHAQAFDRNTDQVTVPFSSLSSAAQQEILALQRDAARAPAAAPVIRPLDTAVSRGPVLQQGVEPVFLDGRKARVGWAIGVYR